MARLVHLTPDTKFPNRTLCGAGRMHVGIHGTRLPIISRTIHLSVVTCPACLRQVARLAKEAR